MISSIKIERCIIMKSFIVFLVSLIILLIAVQNMQMFQQTRDGKRFENYSDVPAATLPPILVKYLANEGARYAVYKIPNYVKDLLLYNDEYITVYKSKPKFSIILISPELFIEKQPSYKSFYDKVYELAKMYENDFNLLVLNLNKDKKYTLKFDEQGYKGLQEHCADFCIIDPSRDTMFSFNRISITETNALEAVFQQYSGLLH